MDNLGGSFDGLLNLRVSSEIAGPSLQTFIRLTSRS
jgi:hypothetical protein